MAALVELLNAACWLEMQEQERIKQQEEADKKNSEASAQPTSTTISRDPSAGVDVEVLSICSEPYESEGSPTMTDSTSDSSMSPSLATPPRASENTRSLRETMRKGRGRSERRLSGGIKRRESHNLYERNRRAQLKTSLEALRDAVPSLADVDRPSTLHVLQQSLRLIESLRERLARLEREEKAEKVRQQHLKRSLQWLQQRQLKA